MLKNGTSGVVRQGVMRITAVLLLSALMGMMGISKSFADIPDELIHLRGMQKVSLSNDENVDALLRTYPFLRDELQESFDMQKKITDYNKNNATGHSTDVSLRLHVGKARVAGANTSLLFVVQEGRLFCGARGCECTIYADQGGGYKKVWQFTMGYDVYVASVNNHVSLYFNSADSFSRWDLKGDKFSQFVGLDKPDLRRDAEGRPLDENGKLLVDEEGNIKETEFKAYRARQIAHMKERGIYHEEDEVDAELMKKGSGAHSSIVPRKSNKPANSDTNTVVVPEQ